MSRENSRVDARNTVLASWLAQAHPELGPWSAGGPSLPAGGPSALASAPGGIALGFGSGRLRAERAGWLASTHPLRPTLVADTERALIVPAWGAPPLSPAETLAAAPGTPLAACASRRALLHQLEPNIRMSKALVGLGLKRRDVDRWLQQEVTVRTRIGPSLGGVAAAFIREGPEGPMALRWDRSRADGWLALDLAALRPSDPRALDRQRDRHRREVDDDDAGDAAFDLAWVVAALREARRGDAACGALIANHLRPEAPLAGPVRVWVEGPPFVPNDLWEPPGASVGAARARWLLAELDGLAVGGGALTVRCAPTVRRGRRTPHREPRGVRERRLFSRWNEGIETDDEGRVGLTPEALAMRLAEGATGVVIDGTCGVGALAIAHARQPGVQEVIAVDISEARLAMARHNAAIYGVEDRIAFVHADVLDVLAERRADRLVLDPPWGGRDYDRSRLALSDLGLDVAEALRRFRGAVRLKLPRSLDVATLPGEGWSPELVVDDRGFVKMLWARRG
ncbi:MAG: methyltransferase [Sandaracinaceae bacterium]